MTIHLLTCSCYAPVSSIFTWVGWVQDIFDIVLIAGENLNYVVDLMRKDKGVNIRKGLNTRLSFLHEEQQFQNEDDDGGSETKTKYHN